MIKFEITDSPDRDIVGIHTTFKSVFYLGRTEGDLLVEDKIAPSQLKLEVTESGLSCTNIDNSPEVLLNSKRLLNVASIKIGDEIKMGLTLITIKDIEISCVPSKREIIQKNLNYKIDRDEQLKKIVDTLEHDLRSIK